MASVLQLFLINCIFGGVFVSSMMTLRHGHLATKVRFFHSDSNIPRLVMVGTLPRVRDLTLAYWVKLYQFGEYSNSIFSYAHPNEDNELYTWIQLKDKIPHVGIHIHSGEGHFINIPCPEFVLRKWQHVTYTWSSQNGNVNVYLNGKLCTNITATVSRGVEVRPGGMIVLGADQDSVGGGFKVKETLEGELIDLHLWDETLDVDQISVLSVSTCRTEGGLEFHGNLIDWSSSAFRAFDGVSFHPTTLCLR